MERQNYYIRAGCLCFDCGISFRTFTIPRDTNLKDYRIIRFLIFAKQMVCSFHVCCPKELNVHLNMSSLCAFSHSNKNSPVCFNLRQDLLYNLVHFCSMGWLIKVRYCAAGCAGGCAAVLAHLTCSSNWLVLFLMGPYVVPADCGTQEHIKHKLHCCCLTPCQDFLWIFRVGVGTFCFAIYPLLMLFRKEQTWKKTSYSVMGPDKWTILVLLGSVR